MAWKFLAALPIAAGLLLGPVAQAADHDWRGGHGGWHGGWHANPGWNGNPGWRGDWHRHGGNGAAAAVIGGLVGLGLGAALANQAYAPPPVAYPPYYGYAPDYGYAPGYYGY